jgi:hypothetical protein
VSGAFERVDRRPFDEDVAKHPRLRPSTSAGITLSGSSIMMSFSKIRRGSLRSIGDVARHQRLRDNDALYGSPPDMIAELCEDNQRFIASLRQAHHVCNEHGDVASASLIDNYIDQAEKRAWFLYEAGRGGEGISPLLRAGVWRWSSTGRRRIKSGADTTWVRSPLSTGRGDRR